MNTLENVLNNSNNVEIKNDVSIKVEEEKTPFWETNFGQIINSAIDFGIKVTLPGWLEDKIIDIKDSVINDGIKAGVETAIEKAVDLGKSIEGIFTGEFDSIAQIKSVIEKGGLLDAISDLIDNTVDWAKKANKISSSTARLIKSSKKTLLTNIENNIDNSLESQVTSIEKINEYIEKWTNYYKNQDFTNMKRTHTRIEKEMEKILPIKGVLEKVEKLENLQELLENNGRDFNLSEEELELAELLV